MRRPTVHMLAGPNGAGKSTFHLKILRPETGLPFINADEIAHERWPGEELAYAYEASMLAAAEREKYLADRRSFCTETVFSHPSKLDFIDDAKRRDFHVHLHVIMVPLALSQARVEIRVEQGGHHVPAEKVTERYHRLWNLVALASTRSDWASFYDNSRAANPYLLVAEYKAGVPVMPPSWPTWTPPELQRLRS